MILAIIQARSSSSRFPEKVLKPILGRPMIFCEIDRVKKSKFINNFVVATSEASTDDGLVKLCRQHDIDTFRGDLFDVLDRYYQCAKTFQADNIVRLTGDCPIIDWTIIDEVIEKHIQEDNDYTSNTLELSYPDGLDVEVIRFSALATAWKKAKLPSEREHVTPYIYRNPQWFKVGCLKNKKDYSKLRWTVDEPEDLVFINLIYELLYPKNECFLMDDVIKILEENPEINGINAKFQRNEGMKKSLEEDKIFHKKKVL
jgi:spore coat polysaccharide biosynthesis protein SpsF